MLAEGASSDRRTELRERERRRTMERIIFHCDLNSFYASVELLDHPELRHLPVAVCGDPESRHGIILAKNEPAKKFRVQTAETIWQAKRKCPDLVLLPAHHRVYREFSRRINRMYQDYTDLVEPFGIDESWLDVSGTLHLFGGDPTALADEIRRRMRQEFGLTISVGVSFNKVFAKLGSDYKKPDATTCITRENFRQMVWPLPVGDLLYVGRAAAETMKKFGVRTIGDLARFDRESLFHLLGRHGAQLHDYANGLDRAPVAPAGQREHLRLEPDRPGGVPGRGGDAGRTGGRPSAAAPDEVYRGGPPDPGPGLPGSKPPETAGGPHLPGPGDRPGGNGAGGGLLDHGAAGAGPDGHRHCPHPGGGSVRSADAVQRRGRGETGASGASGPDHGRHPGQIRTGGHRDGL